MTFNNFGLQYKSGLKNGYFFRIGVTDIYCEVTKQNYGLSMPTFPSTSTNSSGAFEIGLEKREDPSLPSDLRHLNDFSINPGFGFNSCFIYKIVDEFSVSAEVIPRLLYNYSSTQRISGLNKINDTTQGGSFNLDNQSIRVSLIYRWIGK